MLYTYGTNGFARHDTQKTPYRALLPRLCSPTAGATARKTSLCCTIAHIPRIDPFTTTCASLHEPLHKAAASRCSHTSAMRGRSLREVCGIGVPQTRLTCAHQQTSVVGAACAGGRFYNGNHHTTPS